MVTLVFLRGLCGYVWFYITTTSADTVQTALYEFEDKVNCDIIINPSISYAIWYDVRIHNYFWFKYDLDRSTTHHKHHDP